MPALVAVFAWLAALPVSADPPPAPTYRQAVEDAYNLIREAAPDDTAKAQGATKLLEAGTGTTQLEILSDLSRRPPDYEDAKARLLTLLAALDQPADTSDPQLARQRLHDVLSMPRYDALHRPPSLLDRFGQWVRDRIDQLLRLLFGGSGAAIPDWYFYVAGAVLLAVIAFIVFRSTRGRFTEALRASEPAGPRAPADYFAEADRLAARGDRVGAIRNLCAGVAATLAGERTWEGSPLTVREIFKRAPDPTSLLPLLQPFERAVYGGFGVDVATYERATKVAAPFRPQVEVAA